MELACNERYYANTQTSYLDPNLIKDDRVLERLLKLEEHYMPGSDYFKIVQQEVKPFMRRLVVTWMFEVCEEKHCEQDVFPMAVNLLDRFLSLAVIRKQQLQLLGTACMFIASKLKEANPLPAETLVIYTDNSISLEELLNWEILILNKLRWDIAAVVPNDFLEYLFARLKVPSCVDIPFIRKHSTMYISLCYVDFLFSSLNSPSMIAGAAVCAAFEGLRSQLVGDLSEFPEKHELLQQIADVTGVDEDCLVQCQQRMEEVLRASLEDTEFAHVFQPQPLAADSSKLNPNGDLKVTTPTDIQDVVF